MKWQYNDLCQFLVVDIYHFHSLINPFKKMKRWKLDKFGYWVIGASCSSEKGLELNPNRPNRSKDFWKILSLLISINWLTLMSCYSKDIFFWIPVSFTNSHHDVTDLVNRGMVENIKTWISWEPNITFLSNKKNS